MVLTETAESLGCLAEPAPGNGELPRLSVELEGLPGDEIARAHPGDPIVRTFRITNNDPTEDFSGTLKLNGVGESRMPGSSGPMPTGTAVVSMADPVQGDNFPAVLRESESLRGPFGDVCIPYGDPHDIDFDQDQMAVHVPSGSSMLVDVISRPWGMCSDGSCSKHDLLLSGLFDDLSTALACATFVSAVDTAVPPEHGCDNSGEAGKVPSPSDPNSGDLTLSGRPFPDFEPSLEVLIAQIALRENNVVVPSAPSPFSEQLDPESGRSQRQWVGDFAVDSFFDIYMDITVADDALDSLDLDTEVVSLSMTGAPTGFDGVAPFATALTRITDLSGAHPDTFADLTVQLNVIGIDDLFNRRRIIFPNVQFAKIPDGTGLRVGLVGGQLEGGDGK